jgi:hypothetical protein
MKWSRPHFMYHGMMAGMSHFKAHCAFGFWRGRDVVAGYTGPADDGMGQFGRLTSVKDLPGDAVLARHVKEAMKINLALEAGEKPRTKVTVKKPVVVEVPPDLQKALARSKKALATFTAFSPSKRKEYAEWVAGAKREETRERRIATTIEQLEEGKALNWKYENC